MNATRLPEGAGISVSSKWVKINNTEALRVEIKVGDKSMNFNDTFDFNDTFVRYFIFKGDKVYKLEFIHDDNNSTLTQYLEQFETMVSTFKFIN